MELEGGREDGLERFLRWGRGSDPVSAWTGMIPHVSRVCTSGAVIGRGAGTLAEASLGTRGTPSLLGPSYRSLHTLLGATLRCFPPTTMVAIDRRLLQSQLGSRRPSQFIVRPTAIANGPSQKSQAAGSPELQSIHKRATPRQNMAPPI